MTTGTGESGDGVRVLFTTLNGQGAVAHEPCPYFAILQPDGGWFCMKCGRGGRIDCDCPRDERGDIEYDGGFIHCPRHSSANGGCQICGGTGLVANGLPSNGPDPCPACGPDIGGTR